MTNDVYRRAPVRIERSVLAMAILGGVGALVLCTWRESVGIILGGAATWLNFHWLRTSVTGLTDRLVANPEAQGSTALLAARFLLRYAVFGAVVYATLKGSVASVLGVFAGLLLIVPALLIEAGYELYLSRRQDPQVS